MKKRNQRFIAQLSMCMCEMLITSRTHDGQLTPDIHALARPYTEALYSENTNIDHQHKALERFVTYP